MKFREQNIDGVHPRPLKKPGSGIEAQHSSLSQSFRISRHQAPNTAAHTIQPKEIPVCNESTHQEKRSKLFETQPVWHCGRDYKSPFRTPPIIFFVFPSQMVPSSHHPPSSPYLHPILLHPHHHHHHGNRHPILTIIV